MRNVVTISKRQIWAMALLILAAFASCCIAVECIVAIPVLFIMSMNKKITRIEIFCCFMTACLFVVLIRTGMISFPMFSQAAYLFSQNEDLCFWLESGHVHAVRLAIVYPGVIIGRWLNKDVDYGVTLYSAMLMILIVYFMLRMMHVNKMENRVGALFSALFVLALSFLMNGRLIFTFFGISLLALYELKFREREVSVVTLEIITAICVFFTLVSSGTMMVALGYVVLITPYRWSKAQSTNERVLLVLILLVAAIPVAYIFVPYVIVMLMRNVNFFGGGFQGAINVIHHGLGRFIDTENMALVLVLLFAGVIVVMANIYLFRREIIRKNHPDLPLFLLANLSIYGSVFGISTGLTATIPFLVLMIEKMNRSFRYA